MRLKNYWDDLLKRLEDPRYAADYLAQVLAEKDSVAFLIALKDVVEAGGGGICKYGWQNKPVNREFAPSK